MAHGSRTRSTLASVYRVYTSLVIRYYQEFLKLLITVLKQPIDNQLGPKKFLALPIIR